jgi:hypothetical protein
MAILKKLSDSYWKIYRKNNSIVRNPDKIDLMITKSNGAELYIFTDKHCLDSSPETQKLLRDKIEYYLLYINGDDFKKKVQNASRNNTDIIIKFDIQPEALLMEFINNLSSWGNDNNSNILISVKNKNYQVRKVGA